MNRNWKECFLQLPPILREQVLIRFGIGMASCIISLGIIIYTKVWILGIPSLILTLFMIVNSLHLLYNCNEGKYVVVKGRCVEVERTGVKRRIKSLQLKTEEGLLTIYIPYKLKVPAVEDIVIVYLPKKAPVYEVDGGYYIYRFYALEISRKV